MDSHKYIGMDVHDATISSCVLNSEGKRIMAVTTETQAATLLDFIQGLRGSLHVTFEEGTHAAWLYDLLKPKVSEVIVCDPRKNKLLLSGNKGDRVDARKLAELLRAGLLKAVYHGDHGTRALKELARSYQGLVQDRTRVMLRIKAIFRGRRIACAGKTLYGAQPRAQWLAQLTEKGVRQRAESLYQQLDSLQSLRKAALRAMVAECRLQKAYRILRRIKGLGPVRVALIIAIVDTPHRFRTKRQFWAYIGLAVLIWSSGDYRVVQGQVERAQKPVATRGLNRNYNRTLKQVFKSAAAAGRRHAPWKAFYDGLIAKGMRPEMARLTLARKIAAVALRLWKKGERFDVAQLTQTISPTSSGEATPA